MIFFLNFLPILLFELFMFCLINRTWAAFLTTAAVFITASVGNYFKLMFRDDPFMFSDISAIHTALGVSSGYNITLTRRIAICLACIVIGTLFMYFFVRGRAKGSFRIAAAIVIAASVWPLWTFVYSSADIYNVKTENFDHVSRWEATDVFTSKGFVYPFIHSISAAIDTPPDGYDENLAETSFLHIPIRISPKARKSIYLPFSLKPLRILRPWDCRALTISMPIIMPLKPRAIPETS